MPPRDAQPPQTSTTDGDSSGVSGALNSITGWLGDQWQTTKDAVGATADATGDIVSDVWESKVWDEAGQYLRDVAAQPGVGSDDTASTTPPDDGTRGTRGSGGGGMFANVSLGTVASIATVVSTGVLIWKVSR